jgi:hypothetical protein
MCRTATADYACVLQPTDPVINDLLKALHRVIASLTTDRSGTTVREH